MWRIHIYITKEGFQKIILNLNLYSNLNTRLKFWCKPAQYILREGPGAAIYRKSRQIHYAGTYGAVFFLERVLCVFMRAAFGEKGRTAEKRFFFSLRLRAGVCWFKACALHNGLAH